MALAISLSYMHNPCALNASRANGRRQERALPVEGLRLAPAGAHVTVAGDGPGEPGIEPVRRVGDDAVRGADAAVAADVDDRPEPAERADRVRPARRGPAFRSRQRALDRVRADADVHRVADEDPVVPARV